MVFFGSKSDKAPELTPQEQYIEKFKQAATQEIAQKEVAELLEKVTKNCFKLCIDAPGPAVTGAESKCINQCTQKFMEAWNFTSAVLLNEMGKNQS